MKQIFLLALALCLVSPTSAQTQQSVMRELQQAAQLVRTKYSTSESMANIYQMGNNAQGYRQSQYEMRFHNQFYQYLEGLAQNPGQLLNSAGYQDYQAKYWEYCYRTSQQDYRPYQQAAPAMQRWMAQRHWEASTPAGRQAYQNRRVQAQSNFNNHQARHQQANAQFNTYMNGLQQASNQRDKLQHQYVNTIHDQYEYVNPYDGQGYLYSNDQNSNPVMQNPDGSYTELVPYQNW